MIVNILHQWFLKSKTLLLLLTQKTAAVARQQPFTDARHQMHNAHKQHFTFTTLRGYGIAHAWAHKFDN